MLPAAFVAIFAMSSGAVAFYAPPAEGEMAVVFAPWYGEADVYGAIRAAGGSYAGPGRLGNVAVAFATDPGFVDRIRAQGALLIFSATALCGSIPLPAETQQ